MDKIVAFQKRGYAVGTVRNYTTYGSYEKQADGTWKRLRKGYPAFRRTKTFFLMKQFLSDVRGYGNAYLDRHSSPQLRTLLKSEGLTRQFNRWVKEMRDAKDSEAQSINTGSSETIGRTEE